MRSLLVVALIALFAARAHAAADCLEPLEANTGWLCHADLSNGQPVDYCLERTHILGDDPASRFFKMKSTGPYAASCSCRAKGNFPGAAFGEDKTYLCLDRGTDTVVTGKISKRKITGQTFNVSADVRSTFSCEPDPSCTVQPIVDPDLPAEEGSVQLPLPPGQSRLNVVAAGAIDVGYLAGCSGYTSEAPTLTYDVEATIPGTVYVFFSYLNSENNSPGILLVTPSGEAYCAANRTGVSVPAEWGSYAVWIRSATPDDTVEAELVGTYLAQ